MATGDLVTLPQALTWLGQTVDPNGIIATLVSAVSTKIQNYVGYQFAQATYTRTMNGLGGDKMLLRDRPVISVSAVTVDGISVPQSAGPLMTGFLFDDRFVYIRGSFYGCGWTGSIDRFNRGVQNITVTYTAGYPTVPADVQQACLEWLSSGYAMLDNNPTVRSYRAGDTQVVYQNLVTELNKITILMPPSIASILSIYQRAAT
jgi:hypothetical protein